MKRTTTQPRTSWQEIVSGQGLPYHTPEGKTYWDESVYYSFSLSEVELIEVATNELYEMYLNAAQAVIDQKRYRELAIPERAIPFIEAAWEESPPSLYGRFDLVFDEYGSVKLLEFNADTPTALVEAAVVQWYWKSDCFPKADQFNSLHEKLVAKWADIAPTLRGDPLYFCHLDNWEDWMTVTYLRDTASQAGISSYALLMEEIGWNESDDSLRDLREKKIQSAFKLYPWEWLIDEIPSGKSDTFFQVQWIEPVWRMLWSNKGMLPILWELYPDHPYLLEAYRDGPRAMSRYVQKPLLSREGANVTVHDGFHTHSTDGLYGGEGFIYQQLARLPEFSGKYPIIGSWYITDQGAAGIGIRESDTAITDNTSRFVPHIIE